MKEIKKDYVKLNVLMGVTFQPAILFAMSMSISRASSVSEVIAQLYWVIPMHIILGSIPNIILFMIHMTSRGKFKEVTRAFLFGTMLVIITQGVLYIFMFLLFTYGPKI